jgi:hypothetical protein
MAVPNAPDQDAAEPAPVGALSLLVLEAKGDRSYEDLTKKAINPDTGKQLAKQYFQKLVRTPPKKMPSSGNLQAIADGLGVLPERVRRAAAQQWAEYEATELAGYDEDTRVILGHLVGMPEEERRRWRRMIEASGGD